MCPKEGSPHKQGPFPLLVTGSPLFKVPVLLEQCQAAVLSGTLDVAFGSTEGGGQPQILERNSNPPQEV